MDLAERIKKLTQEKVDVVPYDPRWPEQFEVEKRHLLECLPHRIVRRVEHFGSTAVPGLSAKPIIDILVEVTSLEETKQVIVPILESQGYQYLWRPTWGDDVPPWYAWFIKRDSLGRRTHHIHMVEQDFEHWDRVLFRNYLIEHPEIAREYGELKATLVAIHGKDRVAYTAAKTSFVKKVTRQAKGTKQH